MTLTVIRNISKYFLYSKRGSKICFNYEQHDKQLIRLCAGRNSQSILMEVLCFEENINVWRY